MQELLNKLVAVLTAACGSALTVTQRGHVTQFELELGTLSARSFDGLWGAAHMPAQDLTLTFGIEVDDDEGYISDGQVYVITDAEALVYGSNVMYVIEDMIKRASNGMIGGLGSEQGMQGDFEHDFEQWGHTYSIDVDVDSPVWEELLDTVYA